MQQRLDHTISMNRTLLAQRRDLLASAVEVVAYPSGDNSTSSPQHTTMFSRTVAEEAESLSSLIHMTEQPTTPRPREARRIQADIIPHLTEEGRVSWTSTAEEAATDSESIYDDMPALVMLDGTPAPDTPPYVARELEEEEPLMNDFSRNVFAEYGAALHSPSAAPQSRSRAREFQVRVQRYLATGQARRVLQHMDGNIQGDSHDVAGQDIQSMTQWLALPPRRDPLDPPTDTLQSFRDSLPRLAGSLWSTSHSYPAADTSKTEEEAAVAAAARIAAKPVIGGYNDQMAQYELKYGLVDRDGDKIPLHAANRLTQARAGIGQDVIGR
jgi:hypothetical protein